MSIPLLSASHIDQMLHQLSKIEVNPHTFTVQSRVFMSGNKITVRNSKNFFPSFLIKIMDYIEGIIKGWQDRVGLDALVSLSNKMNVSFSNLTEKKELKNLNKARAKIAEIENIFRFVKVTDQKEQPIKEIIQTKEQIQEIKQALFELLPLSKKVKHFATLFTESNPNYSKIKQETLSLFTDDQVAHLEEISLKNPSYTLKEKKLLVPYGFNEDILRMYSISFQKKEDKINETEFIYHRDRLDDQSVLKLFDTRFTKQQIETLFNDPPLSEEEKNHYFNHLHLKGSFFLFSKKSSRQTVFKLLDKMRKLIKEDFDLLTREQTQKLAYIKNKKKFDLVDKINNEVADPSTAQKLTCLMSQATFASSCTEIVEAVIKPLAEKHDGLFISGKEETINFKIILDKPKQLLTLEAAIVYQVFKKEQPLASISSVIKIVAPLAEWKQPLEKEKIERSMPNFQVTPHYTFEEKI